MRALILAVAFVYAFALPAAAQTGMVKGKVVGPDNKPLPEASIVIEYLDGVSRKLEVKTDRRGEFVQIGLAPGNYRVTASADKLGSQAFQLRVRVGTPTEVNFALVPGAGAEANEKADALRKVFDEGVALSQAKEYHASIAKFEEAATIVDNCFDCHYNIGYAHLQMNDEKKAEESWKKALELKPDYAQALNALATMYNNQKRFDEAAAMSAKAASAGGASGGGADAIYNQGIILWNQGKIGEAKVKFEEAIAANATHAPSHFQLGMALLNEGKVPDAVAAFEKYLELAPSGEFAAQAKQMVAQLKS